MHEDALAIAAIPTPAVVLGLLMRPLSIGHILLMTRDGIIAGCESRSLSAAQLSSAAWTCSQTWTENLRSQHDWLASVKMSVWKWRIGRERRRHETRAGALPYVVTQSEVFYSYLSAGSLELPISDTVRVTQTKGRPPGAPFILRLHNWMMMTFGMSEVEAWDYPLGLAKMRFVAHKETENLIDVKNESDESFDRYIAEQEALGKKALERGETCQA